VNDRLVCPYCGRKTLGHIEAWEVFFCEACREHLDERDLDVAYAVEYEEMDLNGGETWK